MPTIRDFQNSQWSERFIDDTPTMNIEQIEARFIELEEQYAIETYPAEFRTHMGASTIGEECWRKLWNDFRWVKLNEAEGRMRRLWNRGNKEEQAFQAFLMWAGVHMRSATIEKQAQFSSLNGHYGGSGDDIGIIKWADDFPVLLEFKTFADKYFNELKKKKVKLAQPKYYAQMCCYGKEFQLKYALFYAVNKDNDELYREIVELDWLYAAQLEKKAGDIIFSQTPPAKISQQASFYKCKSLCSYTDVCHFEAKLDKNCRSCINAFSAPKAKWNCALFGEIPKDFIKVGCEKWEAIV